MFYLTIRCDKKAALCCVALAVLLSAGAFVLRATPQKTVPSAGPAAAGEADPAIARHRAFLAACGWEVSPRPPVTATVEIPAVFGAVYDRYNRLQQLQGFDLAPYGGKAVTKYVYGILSYPGESDGAVRAVVLEYGGRVIGGDISSVRIDGFMHGFRGETDGYDPT